VEALKNRTKKKMFRALMTLNYRTLSNSNIDLSDPIDAQKSTVALKKS
jgi:hypothetical protein